MFAGHPWVAEPVSRELTRRARDAGHRVEVVPAVSATDCLYADLSLDPGVDGCQLETAARLTGGACLLDTSTPLIVLGVADGSVCGRVARRLAEHYPRGHEVVLYEAPLGGGDVPRIERVRLSGLSRSRVGARTTLYVPPARTPWADPDALRALGLTPA